jgi:hypothetical protein
MPNDPGRWSNEDCTDCSFGDFIDMSGWERNRDESCDRNGWQYAFDFHRFKEGKQPLFSNTRSNAAVYHLVRRRKWTLTHGYKHGNDGEDTTTTPPPPQTVTEVLAWVHPKSKAERQQHVKNGFVAGDNVRGTTTIGWMLKSGKHGRRWSSNSIKRRFFVLFKNETGVRLKYYDSDTLTRQKGCIRFEDVSAILPSLDATAPLLAIDIELHEGRSYTVLPEGNDRHKWCKAFTSCFPPTSTILHPRLRVDDDDTAANLVAEDDDTSMLDTTPEENVCRRVEF